MFVATTIGCATAQESQQITPNIGIRLRPLSRTEYRIGEAVSGTATVKVTRTPLQKFFPFFYGHEVVSGDQKYNVSMGNSESIVLRGTLGNGDTSASRQLLELIDTLSLSGGAGFGGSAITHATKAAYFRAIEQNKDVDFLLEPRVSISIKTNSSLFPFFTDEEEATVTVVGRPVMILTDGAIEARAKEKERLRKIALEAASKAKEKQKAAAAAVASEEKEEAPTKKKRRKKKRTKGKSVSE
jgi:hypothetical protein